MKIACSIGLLALIVVTSTSVSLADPWRDYLHRTVEHKPLVVVGTMEQVSAMVYERSCCEGGGLQVYGTADLGVDEVLQGEYSGKPLAVFWYQNNPDSVPACKAVPPRYPDGFVGIWMQAMEPGFENRERFYHVPIESLEVVRQFVDSLPDDVVRPVVIHKEPPAYPAQALSNKIEGSARVAAMVEADGRISELILIASSNSVFDQAALDTVRLYRFKPALGDGVPMRLRILVTVDFKLDKRGAGLEGRPNSPLLPTRRGRREGD
jgi:TonB family protein